MKVYPIADFALGRLAIAARPRGGDWLEQDLSRLKSDGWTVLVSALERDEEGELDLTQERIVSTALGLRYIAFPIRDRGLPEMNRALHMISDLKRVHVNGGSVAIHCRMGIGRSSMLCGAVMVACGSAPDAAWRALASARQMSVPDTDEQRQWLHGFHRAWETSMTT